jgi:hypothetical protein
LVDFVSHIQEDLVADGGGDGEVDWGLEVGGSLGEKFWELSIECSVGLFM